MINMVQQLLNILMIYISIFHLRSTVDSSFND